MNWRQNIKKGTPGHPTYIRGSPLTIFLRARMGGERTRRASFHAIFRSGIRPPVRRSSNNLLHFSVGGGAGESLVEAEEGGIWRQFFGCLLLLFLHPLFSPSLLSQLSFPQSSSSPREKEGGNCSLLLLLLPSLQVDESKSSVGDFNA